MCHMLLPSMLFICISLVLICHFLLSISSNYFLIYILTSLAHGLCTSLLLNFKIFVHFIIDFNVNSTMDRAHYVWFPILIIFETCFIAQCILHFDKHPISPWKQYILYIMWLSEFARKIARWMDEWVDKQIADIN